MRAEYLVACDGMRSPLRTAAGVEFEGEAIDEDFVLGDAEVDTRIRSRLRDLFERHRVADPVRLDRFYDSERGYYPPEDNRARSSDKADKSDKYV